MREEAEWESKFHRKKETNIWGPANDEPEQKEVSSTKITKPPSIWENPSPEQKKSTASKSKTKAKAIPKPKKKVEEKPVINLFDDDDDEVE